MPTQRMFKIEPQAASKYSTTDEVGIKRRVLPIDQRRWYIPRDKEQPTRQVQEPAVAPLMRIAIMLQDRWYTTRQDNWYNNRNNGKDTHII